MIRNLVYGEDPERRANRSVGFPFEPQHGLIVVSGKLWGPRDSAVLRLALDTGATGTIVNTGMLDALGYDPALIPDRDQVFTGSGVEWVPRVQLDRIFALGKECARFPVLGHTMPPSAGIDGLLGLDFLRRWSLTIDFPTGQVLLA